MDIQNINLQWFKVDDDHFAIDPMAEFRQKAIKDLSSKQNSKLQEFTIERLKAKGYSFSDNSEFYDFIRNRIYRTAHVKHPGHWEIWLKNNNKLEFLFSYFIETETNFEVHKDYKMNFVQTIHFRFYQKL